MEELAINLFEPELLLKELDLLPYLPKKRKSYDITSNVTINFTLLTLKEGSIIF